MSDQTIPQVTFSSENVAHGINDEHEDLLREASWVFNNIEAIDITDNSTTALRFIGGKWIRVA